MNLQKASISKDLKRRHVLTLHVRKEYFHQINSGEKTEEYRLVKPYWTKQLAKDLGYIMILLGYPSKDEKGKWITFPYDGYIVKTITNKEFGDKGKWITFPYDGYIVKTITNKEFGDGPVEVYAIRLLKRISQDIPAISQ